MMEIVDNVPLMEHVLICSLILLHFCTGAVVAAATANIVAAVDYGEYV